MVSISISALSLVALIFASLQLFTGIDFTILLLITAVFWFTVAFSNMFIISKFNSGNFEEGNLRKVIVLETRDPNTKFVKFVGSDDECSDPDDTMPR